MGWGWGGQEDWLVDKGGENNYDWRNGLWEGGTERV